MIQAVVVVSAYYVGLGVGVEEMPLWAATAAMTFIGLSAGALLDSRACIWGRRG